MSEGLAAAERQPYLLAMPVFPRPSSPRVALADLRAFLRRRSREQTIGAALAILITAIIVIIFFVDASINTAPPPQVIYVDSWSQNRTDAEIVAQQKKDQAAKEAAIRAKQEQFRKLEKQLGIE